MRGGNESVLLNSRVSVPKPYFLLSVNEYQRLFGVFLFTNQINCQRYEILYSHTKKNTLFYTSVNVYQLQAKETITKKELKHFEGRHYPVYHIRTVFSPIGREVFPYSVDSITKGVYSAGKLTGSYD